MGSVRKEGDRGERERDKEWKTARMSEWVCGGEISREAYSLAVVNLLTWIVSEC